MNIIIHAVNVNTGGAMVLLDKLVTEFSGEGFEVQIQVGPQFDTERYRNYPNVVMVVKKNLLTSLFIKENCDLLLMFGNLPPINYHSNSIVYLHNAYLVERYSKMPWPGFKLFIKFKLLRIYISFFKRNARSFFCQTDSMKDGIFRKYGIDAKVASFYPLFTPFDSAKHFDFCFVGLPSPQKKHSFLFDCIENIAKKGIAVNLAVTIPFEDDTWLNLLKRIDDLNQDPLINITNYGLVSFDKIVKIYAESKSLVFPSDFESFGLPLIEATISDLVVFAPNLDYVNDVVSKYYPINLKSVDETSKILSEFIIYSDKYSSAYVLSEHNSFLLKIKGFIGYDQFSSNNL